MANVIAGSGWFLKVSAPVARRLARLVLFAGICAGLVFTARSAEQFDGISVSPQVFFQGQTFHGYVEMRFSVENQSPDRTRQVTLATPHTAHGWGNNLRRVERTVTVSPGSKVSVTLWQPPLLLNGDNLVEVFVDGRHRGNIPRGGNNQHMQRNHAAISGGPRSVLVSRSLNSDDLDKAFRGGVTAKGPTGHFTAEQATGAPNVPARAGGMHAQAWSPDSASSGGAEWLEVDFKPARNGLKMLRLHKLGYDYGFKTIELKDATGATLNTITITTTTTGGGGGPMLGVLEVPLPPVTNAVQTVRVNVNTSSIGNLGVDAVELSDGSASTYATDARASSTWAARMGGSSSSAYQGPTVLRSELEASGWSESWLAFTPFDLVVLSRTDLAAMTAAQQGALWSYVETGGGLAVRGMTELP